MSTSSLKPFFNNGVKDLSEDHYNTHGTDCAMCGEAEEADPSEIIEQEPISSTAVIQIKACKHTFYKICLYSWLHSQLRKGEDATCPLCRHKFTIGKTTLRYDEQIQSAQACIEDLDTTIQSELYMYHRKGEQILAAEKVLAEKPGDEQLAEALRKAHAIREAILASLTALEEDMDSCEAKFDALKRTIEMRA
jgi:hypothetical protein